MQFYIVDVFAPQKYQGNPLAVLIPDREVSTSEMQQIAKEIHFSETTFIVSDKQADGGYHVRIFTPDVEIPFAGHPSLGTAFVIRHVFQQDVGAQVILNLGVGQIPVTFKGTAENECWMEQKKPTFGNVIHPAVLADILQIQEEDIDPNFPICVASTGLPSVIVPIKTLQAVQKCTIHHQKYKEFLEGGNDANILVFTPNTLYQENDLHVRVFVNDTGYFEDPATGSANGNLAAYLLEQQFFQTNQIRLRVEQGYSIGRPSLLHIDAAKTDGRFQIKIGGNVFFIAKGEWL